MPSVKKRFRGDQFLITYPKIDNENSVQEIVAGQTRALGGEIRYLATSTDDASKKTYCLFKTSN